MTALACVKKRLPYLPDGAVSLVIAKKDLAPAATLAPLAVVVIETVGVMDSLVGIVRQRLGKKRRAWATQPSVLSAMLWTMPNLRCVNWQPKPMVRR